MKLCIFIFLILIIMGCSTHKPMDAKTMEEVRLNKKLCEMDSDCAFGTVIIDEGVKNLNCFNKKNMFNITNESACLCCDGYCKYSCS